MTPNEMIEYLRTTPVIFTSKKSFGYMCYGKKKVFIIEMNESGELCVGLTPGEGDSAWHSPSDLKFVKT